MNNEILVIGNGSIFITPTGNPLENTITVNLGDNYRKLRRIDVRRSTLELKTDALFDANAWIPVGSGASEILLKKEHIVNALTSLEPGVVKNSVETVLQKSLSPSSTVESLTDVIAFPPGPSEKEEHDPSKPFRVFMGVSPSISDQSGVTEHERRSIIERLTSKSYKITCIMTLDGVIHVVAKKKINEGTFKVVSEVRFIWHNNSDAPNTFGPIAIEAKAKMGQTKEDTAARNAVVTKEALLSRTLKAAGARNTLDIQEIKRGNSNKVGLLMEYCRGGELNRYIESHFDPLTGKVKPEYVKQHLNLLIQTANAIEDMHTLANLTHADLKMPNVLVSTADPDHPEIRVSDFGLTGKIQDQVTYIPGTYPIPELLEVWEKEKATYENAKNQILLEGKRRGDTEEEILSQIKALPRRKRPTLTPELDDWSYGILAFEMMYQIPTISYLMAWNYGADGVKSARDRAMYKLDPTDRAHGAIADLLHPNPTQRITAAQAGAIFKQIYSTLP
jgi:hypothetical protein